MTTPSWDCPGEGALGGTRFAPNTLGVRVPFSLQPMARFLRLCTWLLALGPGLLATVRAECSQDCATCSYRLARPTDINPLVSVAAVSGLVEESVRTQPGLRPRGASPGHHRSRPHGADLW